MKKNLLYSSASILFILFFSVSFGQLPVYSWANALGNASGGDDRGNSIATDASGNTYVAGYFKGTADFDPSAATQDLVAVGSSDIFVAKYDASGNYLWAFALGAQNTDIASSLAVDAAGNVYVTGNFSGTVDFDGPGAAFPLTSTTYDVFIAKYDGAGNYQWAKKIGGGLVESYSLALDGSGNVHITGKFWGTVDFDPSAGIANLTATGNFDTFFAKYTTAGIYVWAKSMEGASADDQGNALIVDGTGNVYVTGHFNGTVDFDPSATVVNLSSAGGNEVFIAKYTSAGVYTWAKKIGGTSGESATSIALDASANVYITGYYEGTADFDPAAAVVNLTSLGNPDVFIAKYTTAGLYVWAKSIGGSTLSDVGYSIKTDGSGNVYVTGIYWDVADFDPSGAVANLTSSGNYDIFIAKYTTAGLYVWAKSVGGTSTDMGLSLALDGSGNVSVTGLFNGTVDFDPSASVANLTSIMVQSLFVNKYTTAGMYTNAFATRDYTGGYGAGNATITDPSGNVYITGNYRDTVDFDPSASTAFLTAINGDNIFLAKYDASGNYLWAIGMGTNNGNDEGKLLALDALGNIYVAGSFDGTTDFDPSATTANLTSLGMNDDAFIAKYSPAGTYIWAKNIGSAGQPYIIDMEIDVNGDVVFIGAFWGTVDFDPSASNLDVTPVGIQDMYIAKLNSSGNLVWVKNLGAAGSYCLGASLALDNAGNIYATGTFENTVDFDPSGVVLNLTSLGYADIFIAKYNTSGGLIWAKTIGGTLASESVKDLEIDANENLYLTGSYHSSTDFDPSGATVNIPYSGGQDIFIAKYDSLGNYLWAKNISGANNETVQSLSVDVSGNLIITGSFYATVDFDPSAATVNITAASAGQTDVFIAKYSTSGNYLWAKNLGGTANDDGYGVALGAGGIVYFTGRFNKTIDFDPSAATANITAQSNVIDIYLAKYMHCAASSATTSVSACNSYTLNAQTYTSSGAYIQTLNNVSGCDSVLTINLTINTVVATTSQTNVSCNTGSNGTATVLPVGTFPYTYSWSPSGGTGATATGLSAGTYTCNITDANTCTTTNVFTIAEPTALTATATQTNVTCNLGTNGSAAVVANGGTIGYTYSWSPSGGTAATATGLSAGSYTCNITDANTCTTTTSAALTEPAAIASLQTLTLCAGSSITVGTNTYSITGNYSDVLIASNGCDSIVTTDLTVNTVIDITTSEISGVITATTSGAIYQWLDCNNFNAIISGEIAQTYTAVTGGSYAVSITETGCVDTSACVTIVFTGIQQNGNAVNLTVYPNPTAGEFIIQATAEASYSIVNELGQLVLLVNLNANNNYTSSVSDLNNGVYFIYGINNDQVVKQKIVVIR